MENSESGNDRKSIQEELRATNRVRRTMETLKSLSTITEEPKSIRTSTAGSRSTYTKRTVGGSISSTGEEASTEDVTTTFTLPTLPKPIPHREKKHTSVVLKGTSREIIVPHIPTLQRSPSTQENLMFQIATGKKPLFPTVLNEQTSITTSPSILVTGFGLRNLASLQEALEVEEHKKLQQLYRAQAETTDSSSSSQSKSSSDSQLAHSLHTTESKTESTSETQTDVSATVESGHIKLKYLMGLPDGEEERAEIDIQTTTVGVADEEVAPPSATEAMRQAEKYLRVHKVFEFFQFIICHLLSAIPDDPIAFILALLDQCLVYRTGFIAPPVLYGRKHLEALFNLLDKMRSGYIDYEQYKTGMRTLGVCEFNEKPNTTDDGLIRKEDFIDEAYECVRQLLDDMIRRHWLRTNPPVVPPPPPTPQFSLTLSSCSAECTNIANTGLFLDCTLHK